MRPAYAERSSGPLSLCPPIIAQGKVRRVNNKTSILNGINSNVAGILPCEELVICDIFTCPYVETFCEFWGLDDYDDYDLDDEDFYNEDFYDEDFYDEDF